ncbi:hypothetical protein [Actibacterium pelagium]|uniref:Glycosyltransferase 2-like domain-containing protein n=1 Tax=Actibacterium pelagium TaxID=2029103 RepID=A0A917EPR1_9RHOB|nr:hypothetical protein [Actibacterium pelagium]GGE63127.1 hypothetical protein GCM10011517_33510 [Actibacterium pelagium]
MVSETKLRQKTPVFINSFNQPTYVQNSVNWLSENGFENVTVMDNDSTSPELLEYFRSEAFSSKARLWALGKNIGPRYAILEIIQEHGDEAPFIFSDPDIALPRPPANNFLTRLFELAEKHNVIKVGLALDISRPELFRGLEIVRPNGRRVRAEQWERRYWKHAIEKNVFSASVDTTFFLYVPGRDVTQCRLRHFGYRQPKAPSIRVAGEGFVAQHRPWYIDDGMTDAERQFYVDSSKSVASWSRNSGAKREAT